MNLRPGPSYRLAADLARAGAHPRVCIIATAVGDDPTRLAAVHNAFSKLGFISSHLTLFPMPNVPDVRAHLLAQDVIWVGGGSTANLLALWRLHGLDAILRECWEAGVVLQGRLGRIAVLARRRDHRLLRPDAAARHRRPGLPPLLQQPPPRRRGAAPAAHPPPHRRGHAARRLRHRERDRARLLRHRAARRLHRGGGQDGLLPDQRRATSPARCRSEPGCSERAAARRRGAGASGRGARPVGPGVHRVGVACPSAGPARDRAGERACPDDLGPVHQDVRDADRLGVEAAGPAGQVVTGAHGAVPDGRRGRSTTTSAKAPATRRPRSRSP